MNFEKHTRSTGSPRGDRYAPGAAESARRGRRTAAVVQPGGSKPGNGGVNKLEKPPPRFSPRELPLFT
jgi:hypothetical protein